MRTALPNVRAEGNPPNTALSVTQTNSNAGIHPATPGSVLVTTRYYSAKNKEEVADLLDKISGAFNTTGNEILEMAEVAINKSPWENATDIGPEVKRVQNIADLTVEMH